MKQIAALLCALLLTSCRTDKEILCEDPIYTYGNVKITSRQCFLFGDKCIALIDMFDSGTGQKFSTIASVVDKRIVFTSTRTKENVFVEE